MLYKTEAIILKRINLGEADKIITALSADYGKIRFVAKGVRRLKSKVAGSVEPFYKTKLLIAKGKNLDIVSSAVLEKSYLADKPSLSTIKTADFFAEIIDKLVPDKEPNPELFTVFENSLHLLKENVEYSKLYFESHFYRISGIFPETKFCVKCDQKNDIKYFSQSANGVICEHCRSTAADARPVDPAVVAFWENTAHTMDTNLPSDIKYLSQALDLSNRYLKRLTPHQFKSDSM